MKEKIKHRDKLIRLADRSEAGWDTVLEYEQMSWLQILMMKKRMRQAEFWAPRRKKQKQNERERRLSSNTTNPNTGNMGFGFAVQPSTSQAQMSFRAPQFNFYKISTGMTSASVLEHMATGGETVNQPTEQSKQVTLQSQGQQI